MNFLEKLKQVATSFKNEVKARKNQAPTNIGINYREYLFHELCDYIGSRKLQRILEIGPKDGLDTARLLKLAPDRLILIDLPSREESNEEWLKQIPSDQLKTVDYISANFMYSEEVKNLDKFDCIWFTGVLYHNPEQLRCIKRLYNLLNSGGILVLESATTRNPKLQDENCVEIVYPSSPELKKKYRISANINHIPSAKAIESWLKMSGFQKIIRSHCLQQQSEELAKVRTAFIAEKTLESNSGRYYTLKDQEGYVIGEAL